MKNLTTTIQSSHKIKLEILIGPSLALKFHAYYHYKTPKGQLSILIEPIAPTNYTKGQIEVEILKEHSLSSKPCSSIPSMYTATWPKKANFQIPQTHSSSSCFSTPPAHL